MAHLFATVETKVIYQDVRFKGGSEEMAKLKLISSTLYCGNLKYSTKEEQLFELFSKAGLVKRVIMGLDKVQKTPCGFCFVEFFERKDCLRAIDCLTGTKLNGQAIRCEIDHGFEPGRQYGRGRGGGQIRHEIAKAKRNIETRKRRKSYPERSYDGGRHGHDRPGWFSNESSRSSGRQRYGDDNDDHPRKRYRTGYDYSFGDLQNRHRRGPQKHHRL
mmetsp:Transcript_2232/g.3160  ORF Transcript_2232/g.3160 Transcript_2232/m.3160 type:complete len:217 (+) Transcript_2232:2-652(+)